MRAPTSQVALRVEALPPPAALEGLPGEFFLVQDRSGYWGGMAKVKLLELASDQASDADVRVQELPHLHPDQSLDMAMRRIGDWPLLPVVHRADGNKLVGVVSLADILETYRKRGPALHELPEPADYMR
jgi:CBS domain-containing protein